MNIDITDENGNPVEFTDDIEGVKNYINSAIELKSNEVASAAVNKVFVDNPILKQFVDYLTVNGGDHADAYYLYASINHLDFRHIR